VGGQRGQSLVPAREPFGAVGAAAGSVVGQAPCHRGSKENRWVGWLGGGGGSSHGLKAASRGCRSPA